MSTHAGNHKGTPLTVQVTEDGLAELLGPLGDGRSTQRLLGVLSRLEAYHANLAAANAGSASPLSGKFFSTGQVMAEKTGKSVSGAAITSELQRLSQENRQLRQRQRNAVERLDALLGRLPHLLDAADAPAEPLEKFTISVVPEDAA